MGKYEAEAKGHWVTSAKARKWFYGIGLALSPIAVSYGIINAEESGLWLSLLGAILGVNNALAIGNVTNGVMNDDSNE